MKGAIRSVIYFSLVFLCACKDRLVPADYIRHIEAPKNGLRKSVQIDGIVYEFQYKPHEFIVLKENKGVRNDSMQAYRMKNLKNTAWFNVSMRLATGGYSPLRYNLRTREEYDVRFDYMLNKAVKDIWLVYGNKDTLRPISYVFENNYNLTPQETMVVGFQLPQSDLKPDLDMQFCYDDKVFRNGIVKVTFQKKDLNNIPELNY